MWVDISTYLEQRCWQREPLFWHSFVSMWRSHLLMVLLKTTATAAKRTNHKLTNPPKTKQNPSIAQRHQKRRMKGNHHDEHILIKGTNTIRMQCDNPSFPVTPFGEFLEIFQFWNFYSNVWHLFYIELTHNGSDGVPLPLSEISQHTRTRSHNALTHTLYNTTQEPISLYHTVMSVRCHRDDPVYSSRDVKILTAVQRDN